MEWFHIGFPALMLIMPAGSIALWCYLTGVRGLTRTMIATAVALAGFALSAVLLGPDVYRQSWFRNLWAMGGFFVLLWGFGMPVIRNAFQALPEAPRTISLKPRRVELFRGAFVWPFVAWAILSASLIWAPGAAWARCLGAGLGLLGLVLLRVVLPFMAQEPEPTGGPDPEGLAERQREFRRQRTLFMYWLMVILNLFVTGMAWLGLSGAWVGAVGGSMIGLAGGLFGIWADARRYLLRKELASTEMQA